MERLESARCGAPRGAPYAFLLHSGVPAQAPHMLAAGTTGSGQSVSINTTIASIMLARSPHAVKLILIDPKMVELQMFHTIPHLELPVVTDMKQATNVLLWAVEKMESRYELFT